MLCTVLGLLVFVFLCVGLVVGLSDCRIVGCRIVGLLWKWVSAAFGNVLDQAGHKTPTPSPTTPPARAEENIYGASQTQALCLVP